MRHLFFYIFLLSLFLFSGTAQVLASETTYYRTVDSPSADYGLIIMIMEARWIIMKLVGFFTPVLALLFYLSLKYQDKLNVRSADASKLEMRSMERFERAASGKSEAPKMEIVSGKKHSNTADEPKEYIFQRGQRSFASAGRGR